MNILLINKFFHFTGGADKYFFDVAELLEQHGHRPLFLSTRSEKNRPTEFSRYFVDGFGWQNIDGLSLSRRARAFRNAIWSPDASGAASRIARDHSPDVAHAFNLFYQLSPSVFPALKKQGVATVLSVLDSAILCASASLYVDGQECFACRDSHTRLLTRRCYKKRFVPSLAGYLAKQVHSWTNVWRHVDAFVTASQDFRQLMISWGFPAERIHVNPYFSDVESVQADYGNAGYYLFVGVLNQEKGVDVLLEAARKTSARFVIVGDGPRRQWMQSAVERDGMDNVSMVGWVDDRERLRQYIAGARAILIPSSWYELYPLIALDAFSQGKPVIGSRVGGIPE
ncbi:MAG: glycosyltransferase family 4 protein, partial [Gammaproteobacteria bacterium]|nr:glycosyltransferase family 4 protein [Gammaproteobacteria bacterium]